MENNKLIEILNKISGAVFGYENPFTPEEFMQKFAFDIRLPNKTFDSTDGSVTWAQSLAPNKFISMKNASKDKIQKGWEIPKRDLATIDDILEAWQETNIMVTERIVETLDAHESDNIYNSQSVFRSQDIHFSKYIAFSDGLRNCELVAASQRCAENNNSIRIEDSNECSNSFSIIWSGKIANSMFIQDCFDLYECLFCSHIASKQYYIANMPFEKEEYFKLKDIVIKWLLSSK